MTWQVGWVGSFRVQARALSCNGAPATLFNGGKLVEIKPQDNPITGIQFVGTELEPNCPIPATGHTSKLQATINPNTLFVDWFIDNPSALTPASYVATPVLDVILLLGLTVICPANEVVTHPDPTLGIIK